MTRVRVLSQAGPSVDVLNTVIVVNDEPYCVWDAGLPKRNMEFLNGIDVEHFEYVLKLHAESEDDKRASVTLRMAWHQAMEMLYSLLGAFIQAPDCVYAWIGKSSTPGLRRLVERINRCDPTIFKKLNTTVVSWPVIAGLVFNSLQPGTDRQAKAIKSFGKLWEGLAYEYLQQMYVDEYNSLKHGFRVKPGGFGLAIRKELPKDVAGPPPNFVSLGHSDYGVAYYRMETIGETKDNRNLRSRRQHVNWSVERTCMQLQLISMSIANVVSALKIANGAAAAK